MPHDPSIGVGVFTDYVNVRGSGRMTIIDRQIERILDPNRPAWYPYAAAEAAIKASVASTDPVTVLQRMVQSAPARMRAHYEEIAAGWEHWLTHNPSTLLPVKNNLWIANGLTVKVRHHLGLRQADGSAMVALPYLKQPPLEKDGAHVGLVIMEQLMDNILPGAACMVIDVRRAKCFKLRANSPRRKLADWLQAEAAGYVAHWLAKTA
jgi:hypothetical protein